MCPREFFKQFLIGFVSCRQIGFVSKHALIIGIPILQTKNVPQVLCLWGYSNPSEIIDHSPLPLPFTFWSDGKVSSDEMRRINLNWVNWPPNDFMSQSPTDTVVQSGLFSTSQLMFAVPSPATPLYLKKILSSDLIDQHPSNEAFLSDVIKLSLCHFRVDLVTPIFKRHVGGSITLNN